MNYIDQEMPKAGDTVVVGMSGGVDSTLTAYMLKDRGCKVIGVTMSLWDDSFPVLKGDDAKAVKDACFGPGEADDIEECRKFCAKYDIEYHVIDVKEQYKREVIEYFKSEYRAGRTPNPCIRCNRMIKFGALLQGVEALGIKFDYFCTGHYAKIVRPAGVSFAKRSNRARLSQPGRSVPAVWRKPLPRWDSATSWAPRWMAAKRICSIPPAVRCS